MLASAGGQGRGLGCMAGLKEGGYLFICSVLYESCQA